MEKKALSKKYPFQKVLDQLFNVFKLDISTYGNQKFTLVIFTFL